MTIHHGCVASVHEITNNFAILQEVARHETLISGVEEGHLTFNAHQLGDFFPLFRGGVNSSRIVSASMEQNNCSRRGRRQICFHSFKVKALGHGIEVSVLACLEAATFENVLVIAPSWIAEINWLIVVLLQELSEDAKGASA